MPLFRMVGAGDTIIQNASGTGTVNFVVSLNRNLTSAQPQHIVANCASTLVVKNGVATSVAVNVPQTSLSTGAAGETNVKLRFDSVTGYNFTPSPVTRSVEKTYYYIVDLNGNINEVGYDEYDAWVNGGYIEAYKEANPDLIFDPDYTE